MTRRLLPLVVLSVLTLVACRDDLTAVEDSPTAGMEELFGAARSIAQFDDAAAFARACWDAGSQRGCVGVVRGRLLRERDLRNFLFYTVSRCVRGVRDTRDISLLRVLASLADTGRDSLPPDTVPPDTIPPDTIPPDTIPPGDSIPPDTLPRRCFTAEAGYAAIPDRHVVASLPELVTVATNTARSANPRFHRLVGQGGRVVVQWRRLRDTPPDTLPPRTAATDQFDLRPSPTAQLWRARVSGHVVGFEIVNPLFAYIGQSGPTSVAVGTTAASPR